MTTAMKQQALLFGVFLLVQHSAAQDGGPYDPRNDSVAPTNVGLFQGAHPQIISRTSFDGKTLYVCWQEQTDYPRTIHLAKYSPTSSSKSLSMHVEVGDALDALAGFTIDDDENCYVLSCKYKADDVSGRNVESKHAKDPDVEGKARAGILWLTKLDSSLKADDDWQKDIASDIKSVINPLRVSEGRMAFGKRAPHKYVYHLAGWKGREVKYFLAAGKEYFLIDENDKVTDIQVPNEIAEQVLLGYSFDADGSKKADYFKNKDWHATAKDNGVFEPKVCLKITKKVVKQGTEFLKPYGYPKFEAKDFTLVETSKFYEHVQNNRYKNGDKKEDFVLPKHLRLKVIEFDALNTDGKEIEVPVDVAEKAIIGYTIDENEKRTDHFKKQTTSFYADMNDGIFEPRVKIQLNDTKVKRPAEFNDDGTIASIFGSIELEKESDFYKYLKENLAGVYVNPTRLRLKTKEEEIAIGDGIEVPVEVAEKVLIGYSGLGVRQTSHFAKGFEKFHATSTDDNVFEPKVKLRLKGMEVLKGNKFHKTGKNKGVHNSYEGKITLEDGDFYDFLVQNKDQYGDVAPEKLHFKKTELKSEETPTLFLLIGRNTDWDANFSTPTRHQGSMWIALDSRDGSRIAQHLNGAHRFQFNLIWDVDNKEFVSLEKSDNVLILDHTPFVPTPSSFRGTWFFRRPAIKKENWGKTELGDMVRVSDGYRILLAAEKGNGTGDDANSETSGKYTDRHLCFIKFSDENCEDDFSLTQKELVAEKTDVTMKVPNLNMRITWYEPHDGTDKTVKKAHATRPKMVHLGKNENVVLWELWTSTSETPEGDSFNTKYHSTWAMLLDEDGKVIKKAKKLPDGIRLMRGEECVVTGSGTKAKAAFVAGDAEDNKLILHEVDGDLNYSKTILSLK